MASDAQTICYGVAEGIDLYMKGILVSHDQGAHFHKAQIFGYGTDGSGDKELTNEAIHLKIYADRVNPSVFYGFADGFAIYLSTDGGDHFYQISEPLCEGTVLGLIDCANKTEIRGDAGKEGVFYCAMGKYGLYRLKVDPETKEIRFVRLTKEGENVFRMGLGVLPGQDYRTGDKALYICGIIEEQYGFFRSFDEGKTWEKLNNDAQQFGDINSMDGDSREPYVFYIATGSFGVKYGKPKA